MKSKSRITTDESVKAARQLDPIHPGEILEEEFMRPLGLSANELARRIDVPVTRISEIVRGKRGITADTALRLGRFLGTSSDLWLGLQAEFDLRVAKRELPPEALSQIIPLRRPVAYAKEGPGSPSEVAEEREPYGRPRVIQRQRDRRRNRREREKKEFLALADRLARSTEPSEQKRLKQALARMTFGE